MSIGIIGTKSGMTRVFDESAKSIAVSVIAVEPNRVTQIKKDSIDGYDAVQVTTGTVKQNNVSRPMGVISQKQRQQLVAGCGNFV